MARNKAVVLDDRRARRLARELGLEVIGTLAILRRLYETGILRVTPSKLYQRLLGLGFYIDKELFNRVVGPTVPDNDD
ncbi:DUF3368 domain-containing protein [Pyrodictium abyssi]|uniref:DUF3368 domain-containing protein n=1 Tax=Pyrodictium abyssi TaxID=54256 RepID=A0ABM8IXC6_9CREN|nr:hypothetical protein PABY_17670 [Pyrodictium abyssi]